MNRRSSCEASCPCSLALAATPSRADTDLSSPVKKPVLLTTPRPPGPAGVPPALFPGTAPPGLDSRPRPRPLNTSAKSYDWDESTRSRQSPDPAFVASPPLPPGGPPARRLPPPPRRPPPPPRGPPPPSPNKNKTDSNYRPALLLPAASVHRLELFPNISRPYPPPPPPPVGPQRSIDAACSSGAGEPDRVTSPKSAHREPRILLGHSAAGLSRCKGRPKVCPSPQRPPPPCPDPANSPSPSADPPPHRVPTPPLTTIAPAATPDPPFPSSRKLPAHRPQPPPICSHPVLLHRRLARAPGEAVDAVPPSAREDERRASIVRRPSFAVAYPAGADRAGRGQHDRRQGQEPERPPPGASRVLRDPARATGRRGRKTDQPQHDPDPVSTRPSTNPAGR